MKERDAAFAGKGKQQWGLHVAKGVCSLRLGGSDPALCCAPESSACPEPPGPSGIGVCVLNPTCALGSCLHTAAPHCKVNTDARLSGGCSHRGAQFLHRSNLAMFSKLLVCLFFPLKSSLSLGVVFFSLFQTGCHIHRLY